MKNNDSLYVLSSSPPRKQINPFEKDKSHLLSKSMINSPNLQKSTILIMSIIEGIGY